MIGSVLKKLNRKKVAEPPYNYDFLMSLSEADYPVYLKKIFKYSTGHNLNLKNPKTFNEKIQWLKLYDSTPLKTLLTDKVLARDWVQRKIGKEYLKPVLWVGNSFDEIPFENLPKNFFIKVNHGCKWHCYIKDKQSFIADENLYKYIKMRFDGWMDQSFFGWSAFEFQYKDIIPKLFIEEAMFEAYNDSPIELEVYCFDGRPQLFRFLKYKELFSETLYDGAFNPLSEYISITVRSDSTKNKLYNISQILSNKFKFVRVDFLIHNETLYFNELTFTPSSGLQEFTDKKIEKLLNSHLKIK